MEFVQQDNRNNIVQNRNSKFSCDLQMYMDIPTEQIFIEEFQELAIERVKLLRAIEVAALRGTKDGNWRDSVLEELQKQNVKYFGPLIRGCGDVNSRKCDYLSHFILRLSYCRSEELRRWFLARELDYFKLKFMNLRKEEVEVFMQKNNLNYHAISDDEKKALWSHITQSSSKIFSFDVSLYKVQFKQVLDLVRGRKVFVKSGYAYVPHTDLISILATLFRSKLSQELSVCAGNISLLEGDERLSRILKGLHTSYTGNDYMIKKTGVQLSSLNELSKLSFPLCMRQMNETFQKTHHLRYLARQQFGLFLKGIGLSLEDSLKFWRDGFTQKPDIDLTKFEKQYSYNIRHNYGKEGKRANYTPHNCMKIITSSVGPGDNHGCPFKHYDMNHLKQKLLSYKIPIIGITEITDFVQRGHYQLACTKYFEITHGKTNVEGINHPNQYFEQSQDLINGKSQGNEVKQNSNKKQKVDDWENMSDLNITDIVESAEQQI